MKKIIRIDGCCENKSNKRFLKPLILLAFWGALVEEKVLLKSNKKR
ncbi:hypothetical protein BAXH7_03156 [Bacillus amyloliquefaciens XH7]|nr:hypothetical protein BAXH7_03156 [Bacillus amyloliquefaciens XH7]